MTSVLISGASVAGPALAYWLHRYGFDVTVVERAETVRGGGYPIDVRGPAVEVADRMGILPELRKRQIDTQRISVLNGRGHTVGSMPVPPGGDLELPRGDLTEALYDHTSPHLEYVFGDSIATLDQGPDSVAVTFERGRPRTFDWVVGADGLHSITRRLAFGPEEGYLRYLGSCFAGFSVPNTTGLSREAVIQNTPGRMAALYAVGDRPSRVHGLLAYATPAPPARGEVTSSVRAAFGDMGGSVPRLLAALDDADDVYSDTVSQIRMPGWVNGRVALLGDAAYAPSFVTGQGTSLALVGAYLLAGSLARTGALSAYEKGLRSFVERNQALADGMSVILPRTRAQLWLRNQGLRLGPLLSRFARPAPGLTLPDPAN